jgi:ferredoxin
VHLPGLISHISRERYHTWAGKTKKDLPFIHIFYTNLAEYQERRAAMAYVITDECISCGTCIDECPVEAISEGDDKYTIDPDLCTDCGSCADVCPTDAIEPGE